MRRLGSGGCCCAHPVGGGVDRHDDAGAADRVNHCAVAGDLDVMWCFDAGEGHRHRVGGGVDHGDAVVAPSATHTEPDRGAAAGAVACCGLPEQPLSTVRTMVAAPIVRSPTLGINDPQVYPGAKFPQCPFTLRPLT